VAITAITVLLAVAAGVPDAAGIAALACFAVVVLAGQMSIGWSNDYADARLDAAAGRSDKPLAAGTLRRATVLAAAVVALAVSFSLAVVLGPVTVLWLVPVVGAGWAYNAGLKATPLSGAAYVAGFGPLPGLATSVLPGHPMPLAWALVAASLLGLGAHFVNVLPDLAGDRASGVRGLPHLVAGARPGRLGGERRVRVVALALLLGASALIAVASGTSRRAPVYVGFAATVVLGAVALSTGGRTPFRCALAIAGIDVLMFTLGGGELT
jgi:4-hydroxybenzoate polyprenyltransferase